jgi:Nitrile hydratase beta subunit, C-terminal
VTPTAARFESGDRVLVRAEDRPGHVRTPDYVRGKTGWVEAVLGEFRDPEVLAYGDPAAPKLSLYKVGFRQVDLWEGYAGPARDVLYVDIYEHWLEPI